VHDVGSLIKISTTIILFYTALPMTWILVLGRHALSLLPRSKIFLSLGYTASLKSDRLELFGINITVMLSTFSATLQRSTTSFRYCLRISTSLSFGPLIPKMTPAWIYSSGGTTRYVGLLSSTSTCYQELAAVSPAQLSSVPGHQNLRRET
jgi:hypothetical protein